MTANIFFVTLCSTVLLPSTFGETIFFDKKGGAIEDKAIILSRDEFNGKTVSRIGQEFLRSSRGKSLARLTIGSSRSAVMSALFKVTLRPSYSSTVGAISEYHLANTPTVRILVLQNQASFAARPNMPDSIMPRLPQNITFVAGNASFKLLHFNLSEPSVPVALPQHSLRVFLRASPRVSIASCIAATRALAESTGMYNRLSVEIRPDAWFMEAHDFPALYLFQSSLTPPTEFNYDLRACVTCAHGHGASGDVQCTGKNFYP